MAEFQQAILIDPSLSIALQEMKRTQEMLVQNAPPGQANLTPYERAQKDASERSASLMSAPELNPPVHRVGPLTMASQPVNIVYATVARIAGVNIVWDTKYVRDPAKKFDVDLPEMSPQQAFDFISTVTHTFWEAFDGYHHLRYR